MEGEWSCYGGGQFKGGRIDVTEISSLMEGEWSLRRWPVEKRENGHVTV